MMAVPQMPHQLGGQVTVNGSPAPAGLSVSASINGVEYASGTTDAQGEYGISSAFRVSADDPVTPAVEGGTNGDTINLYVDGIPAGSTTFSSGSVDTLDLSVTIEYTLTVSSGAGGSVTTPGEGGFTYDAGTVVNLVATPASGYQFSSWTGSVANSASASTTVTMDGNKSVTANFTVISTTTYTLTVSSSAGGSVTAPGEGGFTYDAGTVVNLVATPASGYQFSSWTGPVANSTSASTTVTMDGNKSVTANFTVIPSGTTTYTLTVSSGAGGLVTTPGEGSFTYNAGTVVNLVATPASGYQFSSWTGTVANSTSASTTVTMNGNKSVTANFTVISTTTYTLTVSSGAGGSVTAPGEGGFTYDAGTVVNLVATPASGYQFSSWTGAVANSASASTTVTMNGNKSVTANFTVISTTTYTLTVSSGAGGSVTTPGEGGFTYDAGTVVNLVATPASGYQFSSWTGPVASTTSASTTVTMDGNKSVTANFAVIATTTTTPPPPSTTIPPWVWIVLGIAVLAALGWVFFARRRI